jgi:hypothetical protein
METQARFGKHFERQIDISGEETKMLSVCVRSLGQHPPVVMESGEQNRRHCSNKGFFSRRSHPGHTAAKTHRQFSSGHALSSTNTSCEQKRLSKIVSNFTNPQHALLELYSSW